MAKKSRAAQIRAYIASHPAASPADVATKFDVKAQYVYVIRSQMKKKEMMSGVNIDLAPAGTITAVPPKPDMVNEPPHYTDGGMQVIDFIESKKLDYHLGNVVKYVTRAGKKNDELEDLQKARWYLDRAITSRQTASV